MEFSERSGRHIKMCLSCHHSFRPCSATHISPLLKPSSFVFVVQIEKKSMAFVHLFLRPDTNNISPLRAFFRRKKLIEGGGGKGRCCGRPNSYKENEGTRNIGIYL